MLDEAVTSVYESDCEWVPPRRRVGMPLEQFGDRGVEFLARVHGFAFEHFDQRGDLAHGGEGEVRGDEWEAG